MSPRSQSARSAFLFPPFHIPANVDLLYREEKIVALERRAVQVLRYLVENHDRVVSKDELLAVADVVSLHLVLSERTHGILGAAELARMKPGAILVNTARAALVDETALIDAVEAGRLIAALDVFHREPLPATHHLARGANAVLTPHFGYSALEVYAEYYRHTVENVLAFLDGKPIRVLEVAQKH